MCKKTLPMGKSETKSIVVSVAFRESAWNYGIYAFKMLKWNQPMVKDKPMEKEVITTMIERIPITFFVIDKSLNHEQEQ